MLIRQTALVRLLDLRIPMILFAGPRVLALDADGGDPLARFTMSLSLKLPSEASSASAPRPTFRTA